MSIFDRLRRKTPEDPLAAEVPAIAEQAVRSSGRRGSLDYSVASLPTVEELVAEASEFRAEMSEESRNRVVEGFGCYILEVGRRDVGGRYSWYQDRDQPVLIAGEPDSEIAMLTRDRVRARLNGDPADNIPFCYEGFAGRDRNAGPGVRELHA